MTKTTKEMTVDDPYTEKWQAKALKIQNEYSGNTLTDTHLDILRDTEPKINLDLDNLGISEEVQDRVWDAVREAIDGWREPLINEAYQLGFYFAKHAMMKHLSQTEHDDF